MNMRYALALTSAVLCPGVAVSQSLTVSDSSVSINEIILAVDQNGNRRIDTSGERDALAAFVNSRLETIAPQEEASEAGVTAFSLLTNVKEDHVTGKDTGNYTVEGGYRFGSFAVPHTPNATLDVGAKFKYVYEETTLNTQYERSKSLSFLPLQFRGPFAETVFWNLDLGFATKRTVTEDSALLTSVSDKFEEFVTVVGLEFKIGDQWSLILSDDLRWRAGERSSEALQTGFKFALKK
jgi:hypothetical protein